MGPRRGSEVGRAGCTFCTTRKGCPASHGCAEMNACGGAWSPTPHRAPPLRVAVAALARAAPGRFDVVGRVVRDVEEVRAVGAHRPDVDRKSTRLNSSHSQISYA